MRPRSKKLSGAICKNNFDYYLVAYKSRCTEQLKKIFCMHGELCMATLASIRFAPHRSSIIDGNVNWAPVKSRTIEGLPQIFWDSGIPWREANLWLLERAANKDVDLRTVQANGTSLHTYAQWLEKTATNWWEFPPRKADRCLVRYRGALIQARDEGELAPSTASQRMRVAVSFYRWLLSTGLLSPNWPMW